MRKFYFYKHTLLLLLITIYATSFLSAFTVYTGDGGPILAAGAQNCFELEMTEDFMLDSANGLESVCVDIDHPDISSFGILVSNPRNTASFVYQTSAFGDQMLNTCFSDASATSISADVSPYTGDYTPFSELNIVNDGGTSLGIWQVCIFFATPTPVDGVLEGFDLNFNFVQPTMECPLPTNTFADNISGTVAKISWDAVANVDSYKVRYRTIGGDWSRKTAAEGESFLFINGLAPNTTYEYQAKAFCTTDNSTWSTVGSFTTTEEMCGIPENLNATVDENLSATFSWDGQADAIRYKIRYKPTGIGASWITVLVTENTALETALLPDANYKYKLKSKCAAGWTVWSSDGVFVTSATIQENRKISTNKKINIYPNPASHFLNLDFNAEELSRLTIYSAQGIIVADYQGSLPNRIDLSNWQSGFYYLKAERKDNTFETQSFYIFQ